MVTVTSPILPVLQLIFTLAQARRTSYMECNLSDETVEIAIFSDKGQPKESIIENGNTTIAFLHPSVVAFQHVS